jgi:hypothetical protein
MPKVLVLIGILACLVGFPGCRRSAYPPLAERSQLEIRQVQSRSFDTRDYPLVMKSVINVLQDDGFIVRNAHLELGLVTASKELPVETVEKVEMGQRFGLALHAHFALIEASATVTAVDQQTRVRANFQITLYDDDHKKVLAVAEIPQGTYYQDFFSKVDKGIFIQKEKL